MANSNFYANIGVNAGFTRLRSNSSRGVNAGFTRLRSNSSRGVNAVGMYEYI